MFADISGSTQLYETLGDATARLKVSERLDIISQIIKRHNGIVIKTIGDEVMSTFADAEQAIMAACEMQAGVHQDSAENETPGEIPLSIRVGFHYGSAIVESGDVFGDAVNVAARMAAQAKAEQIITTQETVKKLPPSLQMSTRLIDRAPIKGKKKNIDLYEVIWQKDEVTRLATGVVDEQVSAIKLRLCYHEQEIELTKDHPSAVLGRGETADMRIDEELASRQHVRCELRHGRFFIIDQSTNGTYVRTENGEEIFLRRETMPLGDSGIISLGRPFDKNPTEIVYFRHET